MRGSDLVSSVDDPERALLGVLLDDYPAHVSEDELAMALGDKTDTEDAIYHMATYGLIHQAHDGFWLLSRMAHYLANLKISVTRTTIETLLSSSSQLSFRELTADIDDRRGEIADALDTLERRGAVHRTSEDFFWPTRACRRFNELLGCGCLPTETDGL